MMKQILLLLVASFVVQPIFAQDLKHDQQADTCMNFFMEHNDNVSIDLEITPGPDLLLHDISIVSIDFNQENTSLLLLEGDSLILGQFLQDNYPEHFLASAKGARKVITIDKLFPAAKYLFSVDSVKDKYQCLSKFEAINPDASVEVAITTAKGSKEKVLKKIEKFL